MQQNDELFSALLDGELESGEIDTLLEALEARPDAVAATARWRTIGASMRGQGRGADDILAGVRAAVDAEPAQPRVASLDRARQRRMPQRWALPATGLAAAASIALAIVMVPAAMQDTGLQRPAADATGGAALAEAVDAVETQSRESQVRPIAEGAIATAQRDRAERDEILNTYFIEYASHRSAQGIGGPLGYARYAAHNADLATSQPR